MVQMIVLGVVQGLTEFLPVSSTAHLLFTEHFLALPRPRLVLEAALHLGTVVSVLVLFWPEVARLAAGLWASVRHPRGLGADGDAYARLAWLIVVATAVTGVLGFAFAGPLERMFTSVRGAAVQLVVTGLILLLVRDSRGRGMLELRLRDAGLMGVAQAVAIVPGISRSGITIAAATWVGLRREEAARFSFLLSVPAIAGAAAFALKDLGQASRLGFSAAELAVGFVVAAVAGAAAIRWLLDLVRRGRLFGFAVYCWVAGAAVYVSTLR